MLICKGHNEGMAQIELEVEEDRNLTLEEDRDRLIKEESGIDEGQGRGGQMMLGMEVGVRDQGREAGIEVVMVSDMIETDDAKLQQFRLSNFVHCFIFDVISLCMYEGRSVVIGL